MSAQSRVRRFTIATALVAATAVAVGSVAAPAETGSAAPKKITPAGVGGVKLGKTYIQLRRQDLVRKIQKGCPLGGPNTRSALLKAPLKGSVDFTQSNPRKVRTITIRGGARARGVGIGAKIPAIKAAFPKAKVDHATDETFGITLVTVPKNGGGRLAFAVRTDTKRTSLIGVPGIPFCE